MAKDNNDFEIQGKPGTVDYKTCDASIISSKITDVNDLVKQIKPNYEIDKIAEVLGELIYLENEIKDRKDIKNCFAKIKKTRSNLYKNALLPKAQLDEAENNYKKDKNTPLREHINKQFDIYCEKTPEEDRFKFFGEGKTYSKLISTDSENIVGRCNSYINVYSSAGKNNNVKELKTRIEAYHYLKNAQDQKPWYKRAWNFLTGNKEKKAIKSLKESIINNTDFSKEKMEKALNTNYSKHLDLILKVSEAEHLATVEQLAQIEAEVNLVQIKDEELISKQEQERIAEQKRKEQEQKKKEAEDKELDEIPIENPGVLDEKKVNDGFEIVN